MITKDFGIIGESQAIQNVFQLACKVASYEVDILLYGESGVGKELFTQLIHAIGKRRNCPFVAINCGALPATSKNSYVIMNNAFRLLLRW